MRALAHLFNCDWVFSEIFLETDEDYGDVGAALVGFFYPLETVC